jgi:hypothetical protein
MWCYINVLQADESVGFLNGNVENAGIIGGSVSLA